MDKRKEANLRVKNQIVHALLDLMKEKDYEDISISEITEKAGVSRVSYYRNDKSREDILTESLTSMEKLFQKEFEEIPPHTPIRRVMTIFFRTVRENSDLFHLLYQAGMDRQIQECLNNLFLSSPLFPTLDKRRIYPAHLFTGALFNLLVQWYKNDMAENNSELSNLFCQYMDSLL